MNDAPASPTPPTDRLEIIAALRSAVEDVMIVSGYTFDEGEVVRLRGRLKLPIEQIYRPLRERAERVGYTPYLKDLDESASTYEVTFVRGVIPQTTSNPRVNLWLFIATLASTIFAGMSFSSLPDQLDLGAGLMFGFTLMSILGAHEMGHYLMARRRGAPVTLPYFIPLPIIAPFGTLGAVIAQREPFENRRTLLEVGLAGPLAGFIVAVPFLIIGLALSQVKTMTGAGVGFGDSLLTTVLKTLQLGAYIPSTGMHEHPIYIAAWYGMLVTAINLIPAGQLDGGHVAYAILGPAAKYLSYVMTIGFVAMSLFVSPNWLIWTLLLFFFGRWHPPELNQAIKLKPVHIVLALLALIVLVLVFVPNPLYEVGG
jgi:membrane-associated protease RseP (regulator of RpoE activity)